jgi:hypothetical protein
MSRSCTPHTVALAKAYLVPWRTRMLKSIARCTSTTSASVNGASMKSAAPAYASQR